MTHCEIESFLAGERLRYVIIRSPAGICGFPKGHVEGKETERETALREIREETGLRVRLPARPFPWRTAPGRFFSATRRSWVMPLSFSPVPS